MVNAIIDVVRLYGCIYQFAKSSLLENLNLWKIKYVCIHVLICVALNTMMLCRLPLILVDLLVSVIAIIFKNLFITSSSHKYYFNKYQL